MAYHNAFSAVVTSISAAHRHLLYPKVILKINNRKRGGASGRDSDNAQSSESLTSIGGMETSNRTPKQEIW